ncbi:hypothetical protein ASD11_11290 [Aeromicrobium sp. Root495]|uniref:Wzz/FepE/Etk N-terminal domain-containing protein n=1 Tax=Aeromicrobium sp. Root495 TaxID=1736550 RepID=UPI0006FE96E5|nr:Wzz/FepE/Etk N-terminal domain-containing protein [Aeromicrobium sp. Root495]KQY60072.1 hypothetical protein ASD11_11290 [Aeromicrobium sp. Root495]
MELKDLTRALRRRWRRVAALLVVAIAIGVAALFLLPRQYESTVRLYVEPSQNAAGATTSSAETQAASYQALASTDVLVRQVIDSLELDVSPRAFLSATSTTVEPGTAVIRMSVRDRSPENARKVAQTYADTFVRYLALVTGGDAITAAALSDPDAETDSAPAQVVQPADEPGPPVSPSTSSIIALSILIGLALGAASVFFTELRGRRLQDLDDLDRFDDRVTVLGVVPTDPRAATAQADPRTSDAWRRVAASLQHMPVRDGVASIVMTGAGDLSSAVVVAQLGQATAEAGRSTVLVDADLRSGRLTSLLHHSGPGLAEALSDPEPGPAPSVELTPGLVLLPAGALSPDAGGLTASPRLSTLLRDAMRDHGLGIISTAPVADFADATLLARGAGLFVIVVELGRTRVSDLRSAVDSALAVGVTEPAVLVVRALADQPGPRAETTAPDEAPDTNTDVETVTVTVTDTDADTDADADPATDTAPVVEEAPEPPRRSRAKARRKA